MKPLKSLFYQSVEPRRFLGKALFWMRWMTIAAVLMLVVIQPAQPTTRFPVWPLIALFAGYNLLADILRTKLPWSHFVLGQAVTDVLAIGAIYALNKEPGGPLFLLFFLAIACAAATLPVGLSLLYTALVAGTAMALELTFVASAVAFRQYHLDARLTLLALMGLGMTVLRHSFILQQQAIQAAREEAHHLSHLDQMREEFIATISHDLRTPLTAARASLGMLDVSVATQMRDEDHEMLENARRNVERLQLMIDDLLVFNQLKVGALQLECQSLDLVAVIESATLIVRPLLRQKAQVLEVHVPDRLLLVGDRRRLEQVIVNLLANAHQHTPQNTHVVMSVELVDGEVHLLVNDTGPGIAEEELEAIFQRFHRLAPTDEGAGLGLAIAKQIVELHGGRMWAESRPGAGSTFHLILPHRRSNSSGSEKRENDAQCANC